MRNILLVTSSLMGENSKSNQVAEELVATLRGGSSAPVAERRLSPDNMPHLSLETLGALGTPADQRTPSQQQAVAFADALIEEVEAADVIVLAAPMYNFTIPSTLKAWLDHIARAKRTFRYNEQGRPEGLLKGRKVYVVVSRGGYYSGENPVSTGDFQETYLKHMLGFVGLDDVSVVHIEGQAVGPDAAAKGLAAARGEASELLAAA